ncbi:MAG: hypothetical protein AB1714_02305 [Acidobacteriota bacterium]
MRLVRSGQWDLLVERLIDDCVRHHPMFAGRQSAPRRRGAGSAAGAGDDVEDQLLPVLKSIVPAGAFCCGSILGRSPVRLRAESLSEVGTPGEQAWVPDLERRMIKRSESPGWVKAEKAEYWIKDLMANMDEMLDRETTVRLMQACGRSCFRLAFGVTDENKSSREDVQKYLRFLEQRGTGLKREGHVVTLTFNWGRDHQNPWGLTMRDGYCMCPLVESGPPGLSPT